MTDTPHKDLQLCEESLAIALTALHAIAGKPDFADDPWEIAAKALELLNAGEQ